MASSISPSLCWATLFGPYRHLLGVRASGWSARFKEFVEDLGSVEASVVGLITVEEAEDMAGLNRTWDCGPLLMMEDMVGELRKLGVFGEAKAKPPQGETIPNP